MTRLRSTNAVIYFLFWLAVLYAGADHPPSPGFVTVALLDLAAAGLVYWRVPVYLAWIASRCRSVLLFVVLDGLVANLAFAALLLAARYWRASTRRNVPRPRWPPPSMTQP